ncbi:MAG TPA: ShlB/FhaC/HecB family hemolysin secretion/activation protein [Patescibacteria group bacterium]|nr:ShlB/FhaC/HecB family hemolysin secretion/activation protein [Patescibacteria group bacterium]
MPKLSRIHLLAFAAALLAFIPAAQALTPADLNNAAHQSDRIQREQLQRQQEDIDRAIETGRPQTTIEAPSPQVQHGKGSGCRLITRIELKDTVHMSKAEMESLVSSYAGRCLGVDDIQNLLSAITAFYVKKGFVTTRVYLPAQDLTKGTLQIKVVEGRVSDIRLDNGTGIDHLCNIFPNDIGEDLNLRDYEQGIDQLNRLLSNNTTMDIQPGANPGESIVIIKNKPTKFWHMSFTADDYGTRSTGRNQAGVTASFDNLTSLNDFLSVTQRKTVPFGDGLKDSNATTALWSIPYGYATFTTGVTWSAYDSTVPTASGNRLHLEGETRDVYATLERVVYRDQFGKATVNATLTNDVTDTFIDDQKIGVSSRTLTWLQLGANYNTVLWGGTANLGVGYYRGLNLFHALNDPDGLPGFVPRAQFTKYTLSAGYSRPFAAVGQKWLASTQFNGQYAPTTLYGSQQFSVGGIYTVRGFFEEQLANDHGYFLRNDLTLLKSYTIWGHPVGFRPFAAFDFGSVGSDNAAGTAAGTLGGAALGFDLSSGPLDFNIYTGYPLFYPDSVTNERFNTFARLTLTF